MGWGKFQKGLFRIKESVDSNGRMGKYIKQIQSLTLPLDAGNASKCFLRICISRKCTWATSVSNEWLAWRHLGEPFVTLFKTLFSLCCINDTLVKTGKTEISLSSSLCHVSHWLPYLSRGSPKRDRVPCIIYQCFPLEDCGGLLVTLPNFNNFHTFFKINVFPHLVRHTLILHWDNLIKLIQQFPRMTLSLEEVPVTSFLITPVLPRFRVRTCLQLWSFLNSECLKYRTFENEAYTLSHHLWKV